MTPQEAAKAKLKKHGKHGKKKETMAEELVALGIWKSAKGHKK